MIRIRTDESLFIISHQTLSMYSHSELYKVIHDNIENPYIIKEIKDDNITLYIDIDPDIMKIIVRLMRGGNIAFNSSNIDSSLLYTSLEKLGFLNLIYTKNNIKNEESDCTTFTDPHLNLSQTENKENIFELYDNKNILEMAELNSSIAKSLNASIKSDDVNHNVPRKIIRNKKISMDN